jgi:ubiquinone/menaquinone biosynthesis C-methylase UbiE
MINVQDGKIKAASSYNSASDHFNDHPLSFWDFRGRKTIEHLRLNKGDIVLDVGCGAGASAIPAAKVVGQDGKVIGIDLAEKLLEYGQKKAAKMNLKNIEFRVCDMEKLEDYFPDITNKQFFSAVVCVFAIFFVNDMESQIRRL